MFRSPLMKSPCYTGVPKRLVANVISARTTTQTRKQPTHVMYSELVSISSVPKWTVSVSSMSMSLVLLYSNYKTKKYAMFWYNTFGMEKQTSHYLLLKKIKARTTAMIMTTTANEAPTAAPTLPPPSSRLPGSPLLSSSAIKKV